MQICFVFGFRGVSIPFYCHQEYYYGGCAEFWGASGTGELKYFVDEILHKFETRIKLIILLMFK